MPLRAALGGGVRSFRPAQPATKILLPRMLLRPMSPWTGWTASLASVSGALGKKGREKSFVRLTPSVPAVPDAPNDAYGDVEDVDPDALPGKAAFFVLRPRQLTGVGAHLDGEEEGGYDEDGDGPGGEGGDYGSPAGHGSGKMVDELLANPDTLTLAELLDADDFVGALMGRHADLLAYFKQSENAERLIELVRACAFFFLSPPSQLR